MGLRYYSSVAERTTLAGAVSETTTTFIVNAVIGWPVSFPYTLIIDGDTINEEIVQVTARSATTLTVVRGVDGSTAKAHDAGAGVWHGISARDVAEPNVHVNTNVIHVSVVTSSTRPGAPAEGQIIYETDTNRYFGFNGSQWVSIGGGAAGTGADEIFYENDQVVSGSYTITSGRNAMTAGPVTVDSGVVVTIPSGSTWTVV
jgi:hypothetical protein